HIDKLHAPITVTYGTLETPDFQRQSRDFAAAVKAAGKPVEIIEAPNYHHLEMAESLGNPYGPNGRAALALMKLPPASCSASTVGLRLNRPDSGARARTHKRGLWPNVREPFTTPRLRSRTLTVTWADLPVFPSVALARMSRRPAAAP